MINQTEKFVYKIYNLSFHCFIIFFTIFWSFLNLISGGFAVFIIPLVDSGVWTGIVGLSFSFLIVSIILRKLVMSNKSKLSKSKYGTPSTITLVCLVQGNELEYAFPVDIDKSRLVGHLKKIIKKKKIFFFSSWR